jgi:hypothetical protein
MVSRAHSDTTIGSAERLALATQSKSTGDNSAHSARLNLRKRCSAQRSAPPDYGSEGWGFDSLPARFRRSEAVCCPI